MNNKAFTLTELIVTISMIIILAVTWAFYGRGHVKIAMLNEGRLFADRIIAQEKNYFSNQGAFVTLTSYATTSAPLFVDTKTNSYFKAFKISYAKPSLTVIVKDATTNNDDTYEVKVTAVYNTTSGEISYTEDIK